MLSLKSRSKAIGMTMGDPHGVGPEICAHSCHSFSSLKSHRLVLIGDKKIFQRFSKKLFPKIDFVDCVSLNIKNYVPGKPTKKSAQAALIYLNKAITLLKKGAIHGLVTAPLSKESVASLYPRFEGHTEYLAEQFGVSQVGMLFIAPKMKVIIATRHMALKDVSSAITEELLLKTAQLTSQAMKTYFKIKEPRIAFCGLNPHAGEHSLMGREEEMIIRPALEKLKKRGILANGPFAADTLFVEENAKKYDVIVSMYHDQGLAPIKALYFHKLVNLTIGLPFIRTSPAHGTAFDIAGKGTVNPSSMIEAVKLAVRLT